jgi:hypothetical protein
MCGALIGVPKTSRDTKKDCGKPGCPNDHHGQVLALGDEVIKQSADRSWHETDLPRCPQFGRYRG